MENCKSVDNVQMIKTEKSNQEEERLQQYIQYKGIIMKLQERKTKDNDRNAIISREMASNFRKEFEYRKSDELETQTKRRQDENRSKELEHDQKNATLFIKARDLKVKIDELNKQADELKKKEDELKKKEDELKKKEDAFKIKEVKFKTNEDVLKNKEDELKKKEDELKIKEDELKKKEDELKIKEDELGSREDELKIMLEEFKIRESNHKKLSEVQNINPFLDFIVKKHNSLEKRQIKQEEEIKQLHRDMVNQKQAETKLAYKLMYLEKLYMEKLEDNQDNNSKSDQDDYYQYYDTD